MIYTVPDRDPELGYIDNWLWLPKKGIAVETLRRSLRIPYVKGDRLEYIECWRESRHHLGVPRCRIDPAKLPYDVVDLRPTEYERADIRSSIELDSLMPERDEQTRAYDDVVSASGGILNLSCVSADTQINFNRGGKGFSMSIGKAYERLYKIGRYSWNSELPTYVRAKIGDRIGLQKIHSIVKRGLRMTRKITLEDGKSLRITGDHEVLTPNGWVRAERLTVGDEVIVDGKLKPRYKHLEQHRPGYAALGLGVPTPVRIQSVSKGKMEQVYDIVCDDPHHNFVADGIVVHNCGKGKTVIMLHCLAKWGKPALIINDKVHILKQWKKEIARFLEVPSVGWIQGGPKKWDWEGHPIVLASFKTLTTHHDKLPMGLSRRFGVVVWDEIHHLAAPDYSKTAHMFIGNRYGATATAKRPDGNQVVYYWHVGREVHVNKTQDLIPTVKIIRSKTTVDERHPDCLDVSGNVHAAKLGIHVGRQPEETELGLKLVQEARDKGRDLVAVSTSKEHSRRLHELVPDSGVIDADVDPDIRGDVLADHKVTFGTIHILSEAINKQSLDSLLLLMEFTSEIWMEQAVGRIQRLLDGKKEIRVVMIWHVNVPRLKKRGEEMMRLFREMGYKVKK